MSARLIEDRSGKEHELQEEGVTLGRHGDNAIPLAGRAVSRFHAEIRFEDGGWIIEDHGSTYGTFINGQKVEGTAGLKDGDKVRVAVSSSAPQGEFNFVFRAEKPGLGTRIRRKARAIVGRRKVDLGRMIFERTDDLLVVRLDGIFRRREMDALYKGIGEKQADRLRIVALDFTKVSYMNSYGLACLVRLGGTQREGGKSLRIFGAKSNVLKLLKMSGESSPIMLLTSEDEALTTH